MGYGQLTERQAALIRPYVEGREVHDLGAGDLALSLELLGLGASKVIAIDRDLPSRTPDSRITLVKGYFHAYRGEVETAFVSWPCNWQDTGLIRLVEQARVVIYLGKNTDGTMCGGPEFFWPLFERSVAAHEPDPKNTLIVYGGASGKRKLLGEERAAIHLDRIWSYEETIDGGA